MHERSEDTTEAARMKKTYPRESGEVIGKSDDRQIKVLQIIDVVTQDGGVLAGKGDGIEEKWGRLRDLDEDMLAEVFSYLPQRQRIEVILLNKHWEKAMREGHVRWRKVKVVEKWDMEVYQRGYSGSGVVTNETILRVLGAAEDITFSTNFKSGREYIMFVGGVLRQNLRYLELPDQCVYPAFYPALLANCPYLRSLVVKGEAIGTDPIFIRHPQLEFLEFFCQNYRPFSANCPRLTHLSTNGYGSNLNKSFLDDSHREAILVPSLCCPRLQTLSLSVLHCAPGVLESMALYAPDISCLKMNCICDSPFSALTNFKSLEVLRLPNCVKILPSLSDQWPHLKSLVLYGQYLEGNVEVRDDKLRSLEVLDLQRLSPRLMCPSLEILKLTGSSVGAHCLQNLKFSCPKLRRVHVEWLLNEGHGPLDLVHTKVEELEMVNTFHQPLRLACSNLRELTMKWYDAKFNGVTSFEFECPNLSRLHLCGCTNLRDLPLILSTLSTLKSLKISKGGRHLREVVLKHSRIQDVVVDDTSMQKIVLLMSSLVQISFCRSIVRVLQLASNESVSSEFYHSIADLQEEIVMLVKGGKVVHRYSIS